MTPFAGWENYYVIVGSSAGALIGLQFVVLTLITTLPLNRVDSQAGDSYTTPTVVHFGAVLLLAALACVPWTDVAVPAALWGLIGVAGIAYVTRVAWRLHSHTGYRAVLEDWLFHVVLPLGGYTLLAGAAVAAFGWPRPALFAVAATALLLLFAGIHNAWDIVRYHVFENRRDSRDGQQK